MSKSGLADSPFFTKQSDSPVPESVENAQKPVAQKGNEMGEVMAEAKKPEANKKPRYHDTMTPRNHDTVVSSNHDTIIQTVRRAVKELGKEAATHRFTVKEKRAVLDLIYTYKNAGITTSENEVARIAINYVLEDYKQNGENSILDQTLKALNE